MKLNCNKKKLTLLTTGGIGFAVDIGDETITSFDVSAFG